jgi:AcrR family transcriptional regulator
VVRVLDAVRDLVLAEGPAAVTHARVAERARVGRATLYRHWPERTGLLRAALGHARFPAAPRTGDTRGDLVALLESLRAAMVDGPLRPILATLMAQAEHDPEIAALCAALTGEGHAATVAVLRDGIARGVLRVELDVERAVAALGGPVFYRAFVRGEPLGPEALPAIVDDALRGAWAERTPRVAPAPPP